MPRNKPVHAQTRSLAARDRAIRKKASSSTANSKLDPKVAAQNIRVPRSVTITTGVDWKKKYETTQPRQINTKAIVTECHKGGSGAPAAGRRYLSSPAIQSGTSRIAQIHAS